MASEYGQYENVMPILSPADITNSATFTKFTDLRNAQALSLYLHFGTLTTTTAADHIDVTVVVATGAATTGATAIAFNYRLSSALLANAWGSVTAVAATGTAEIASTDDDKMLQINVDPAVAAAALADGRYIAAKLTPDGMANTLVSGFSVSKPRYKQTTMNSAT
jgi:hypothetical protein